MTITPWRVVVDSERTGLAEPRRTQGPPHGDGCPGEYHERLEHLDHSLAGRGTNPRGAPCPPHLELYTLGWGLPNPGRERRSGLHHTPAPGTGRVVLLLPVRSGHLATDRR